MAKTKIRVLVADDSALMRRTLRRIIDADPDLVVIDTARDGEDAVNKVVELRPDVVSMDINMPKLDGITALQIIIDKEICPVVMVSSLTQHGAATTFEALELGAFDFVGKPGGTVSSDLSTVAAELCLKLKAAARAGTLSRIAGHRRRHGAMRAPPAVEVKIATPARRPDATMKAVVIGISTGGPATIQQVLPHLPAEANATFFLVQHMPGSFTAAFARRLDETSPLTVLEASAALEVKPGHCYVGRGDYQMTVYRGANGRTILRTPSTPETLFKPSANVTMESVLGVFGKNTIGVLMTGIGDDGADMMVKIKQAGGYTIAESEESAVVYGMPREAIERGGAHIVLPSWDIAKAIARQL